MKFNHGKKNFHDAIGIDKERFDEIAEAAEAALKRVASEEKSMEKVSEVLEFLIEDLDISEEEEILELGFVIGKMLGGAQEHEAHTKGDEDECMIASFPKRRPDATIQMKIKGGIPDSKKERIADAVSRAIKEALKN